MTDATMHQRAFDAALRTPLDVLQAARKFLTEAVAVGMGSDVALNTLAVNLRAEDHLIHVENQQETAMSDSLRKT